MSCSLPAQQVQSTAGSAALGLFRTRACSISSGKTTRAFCGDICFMYNSFLLLASLVSLTYSFNKHLLNIHLGYWSKLVMGFTSKRPSFLLCVSASFFFLSLWAKNFRLLVKLKAIKARKVVGSWARWSTRMSSCGSYSPPKASWYLLADPNILQTHRCKKWVEQPVSMWTSENTWEESNGGCRRATTKSLLETNVSGAVGSVGMGLSELASTTWHKAQA